MVRLNAKNCKQYSKKEGYIGYVTAGNSIAILKVRDNASAFMYLDMVSNGVFKANTPEDSVLLAINAGREVFYFKDRKEFGYYILQCDGIPIVIERTPTITNEIQSKGRVFRPITNEYKDLTILLLNHFK